MTSTSSAVVPATDAAPPRRPAGRWPLKGALVPVLTSALLAAIARPVFWQEGLYLDDSDSPDVSAEPGDRSVTVGSAPTNERQPERPRQTIQIGRQPVGSDRLPEPGFVTRDLPSLSAATPADSPSLRISQGFQQSGRPAQVAPLPLSSASAEPLATEVPATASNSGADTSDATPIIPPALTALLVPPSLPQPVQEAPSLVGSRPVKPSETTATIPSQPPQATRPPAAESPPVATSPPVLGPAPDVTSPQEAPAMPVPPQVLPPTAVTPEEPPMIGTVPQDSPQATPDVSPPAAADIPPQTPPRSTEQPLVPDPPVSPLGPANAPTQTARATGPIRVEQFVVTGSTVFDAEDLAAIALMAAQGTDDTSSETNICDVQGPLPPTEPLSLTPSQLVQASDAIEQCYIQGSYINSGAFIAETELTETDDGIIEISVIEGQLEDINVDVIRAGLFGLNPGYVESRLDVALSAPFNLDDLLDAVRLLEQDPLINQISTEIVPGTETGSSILNASVVQDNGFDLTAFLDNDRSPSVGSFRQGIALSQANLLGIGDRLSLGFNSTEGSSELSAGYTIPINARNGTIGFNFSSTESEVIEEPFTVLDIFSESTTYELFYRQPLILTPTQEFALSLRASHRNSQAEFLETINDGEPIPFPGTGADAEGRTRVTAVRFGQEWISRNSEQVIALLSEFSFGLDLLDATIQPVAPDGRFFLWRGQGQWVRSLGPDSLFILRGNVQLADRPLLPNEQFSFGGQRAGRGYRLNTLLRDNGWFLSTELRFPLFRIPEQSIVTQIAPFFEVGGGWNEGAIPETEFLTSTGLGLIFQLDDDLTARLDWAIPLSDFETTGNSLQDSGIYFSIQATPF